MAPNPHSPNGDKHGSLTPSAGGTPPGLASRQDWRRWLWLWVLMLCVAALFALQRGPGEQRPLAYSAFRDSLQADQVKSVVVKGDAIGGQMRTGKIGFVTRMPSFGDQGLMPLLQEKNVTVTAEAPSSGAWWIALLNIAPFLLLIGLGWFFVNRMRQQGGQVFQIGRSRAHLYERTREQVTFADVAGAEGAKRELHEIIDFLKEPTRFRRLGGAPPKGVLLVGPPGCGKTLMARATAGEANVPFFSITGSDFVEMFVGVGASRVRDLFQEARRVAPSIIFIDELDSIGRRRGAGLGGGHDEREQTLNQLLSEMDGFEPATGTIVIAATNRPDVLDAALLRPGRFDRHITVDLVGARARREVLAIHARGKPLAPDVDLDALARATPSFSGADLANLLNEAALLAARRRRDTIDREDVDEAYDKILLGLRREGLELTEAERRIIAVHETGHAIVAGVLPHADPVRKVTVTPRGQAMGVTHQLPERDHYLLSRDDARDRLAILLGGRAAERLVFGAVTNGAESDLQQAIRLARQMVLSWGMSDDLPDLALGGPREHIFLGQEISEGRSYSEATARQADSAVAAFVAEAAARARSILNERRAALHAIADELLEHEELPGSRIAELLTEHAAAAA
jgi:cell division protease FtsH